MDKDTAKQILSAYRPGGQDSQDADMREALALCRADAGMQGWFDEEQTIDRGMTHVLKSIHAPEAGLTAVLKLQQLSPNAPKPARRHLPWLGLAAGLILLFSLVHFLRPMSDAPLTAEGLTPQETIAYLADTAMPLDYYNKEMPDVSHWLSDRQAPSFSALPAGLQDARPNGCRVLLDAEGNPVSLICMQFAGERVHIMVMSEHTPLAQSLSKEQWEEADGWKQYSWNAGGQTYVLVSKGDVTKIRDAMTPA